MKESVSPQGLRLGPFLGVELSLEFQLKYLLFHDSSLTPRCTELPLDPLPFLVGIRRVEPARGVPATGAVTVCHLQLRGWISALLPQL